MMLCAEKVMTGTLRGRMPICNTVATECATDKFDSELDPHAFTCFEIPPATGSHPQHHSHHQSISSLSNSSFPSRPPSTNPTTFNTSITTSSYPRSNPYGPAPPTRQTSNTSSASSTISSNPGSQISGSENWETYSSASSAGEPETDVRDTAAYYARLRAQQGNFAVPQQQHHGKRMAADGGWNSPGHLAAPAGKRVKGLMGPSSQSRYVSAEGGQVEGSEAGWTDEDGF